MKEMRLSDAIDRITHSSNLTVIAPIGEFGTITQNYSHASLFPETYCSKEMLCFSNRTYKDALTYIGSDNKNSIVLRDLRMADTCGYSKLPFAEVYDIHIPGKCGQCQDVSVWVR